MINKKLKLFSLILIFALMFMGIPTGRISASSTPIFINEIHYDNTGTDAGEAIEIFGPAGTDLTGWSLVLVNGSNGLVYDTDALSGTIPDLCGGFGVVVMNYPTNGIQNGSPDGIALVNGATVVQFLSYEGAFAGVDGVTSGITSTDIGVAETGSEPLGQSLQLTGSGSDYSDFTWNSPTTTTASFGSVNSGQTCAGGPTGDPEIVITEIMYDPNSAEDNWEWIEIYNAGSSTVDLTGFVVDDINSVAHGSANIAGGTLTAGEQAILYNTDDVTASDFAAAWGNVNLIPVTNWSAMALNNGGDQISLWKSFDDYSGDNATHANAFDTVNYAGAGFPDPVGASIFLTDLGADNNVGGNWATSTDGGATPLFTGYTSTAAGGNTGTDIGSPGTQIVAAEVMINEFSASTTGTDVEYVEIFGTPGTDLSSYAVLEIEGDSESNEGTVDEVISLGTTDAGGFYLASLPANALENGTITLLLVSNFSGAAGSDLDTNDDGILDATPWDTIVDAVAVNDGGAADLTYGTPALGPNFDGLSSFAPGGASRIPDGFDTDAATDWARNDFDLAGIPGFTGTPVVGEALNTPGAPNELFVPPPEACGDPVTHFIYEIQGNSLSSPLVGTEVAIEAIVVGDFQNNASLDNGNLNGFHVQEEDAEADGDPSTSDGIFVFAPGSIDVSVGDKVRVRGTVAEFFGLTEITGVSTLLQCSTGNPLPSAATVSLPVLSVDAFEAFEGMRVTIPQALYISEYFNFDRFGEFVLTTDRFFQPTAQFEPGSTDVSDAMANYLLNRITLDDGRTNQNPDPAIHPNGNVFDLNNLFRGGDTVANVTGVMDFAFGLYRIQPTEGADYTSANPRTSQPDDVGGNLKVASFNVLNYFTSIDFIQDSSSNNDPADDICGPEANQECRGADDENEFERQRAKIISAIAAIDADVVGLIEIENYPGDVPTDDLVSGLNDAMGAGTYAYIATGGIGTDAIRVAFIYKPATVTPLGPYAVLDTSVDPRFLDDFNRPALAQTFQDNLTGGIFTAVVNHLKSKGSACDSIGDPDTGDGAGNCNLTRKAAAEALVDWLATDPTGSGDPDFLIIGDLNSYDKEDPIDAILEGSDDALGTGDDYDDLLFNFLGEFAYSYLFDGQLGYLDHALANQALLPEVTGVTVWHINADEADLIDYDTTFKQDAQDAIYAPDAYRSSDHDPVIVGLDVCEEIAPVFDEVSISPDTLWPANHHYVDVTATVVVSDNFDPNPTVTLLSVTSNEPDDGDDDGNTVNDIVVLDDFHFQLRAERSGIGTGRVYTITYMVTDACGNSATTSVTVTVPLSQGNE